MRKHRGQVNSSAWRGSARTVSTHRTGRHPPAQATRQDPPRPRRPRRSAPGTAGVSAAPRGTHNGAVGGGRYQFQCRRMGDNPIGDRQLHWWPYTVGMDRGTDSAMGAEITGRSRQPHPKVAQVVVHRPQPVGVAFSRCAASSGPRREGRATRRCPRRGSAWPVLDHMTAGPRPCQTIGLGPH